MTTSLTPAEQTRAKWIADTMTDMGAGEAFCKAFEAGDTETVTHFIEAFAETVRKKEERMQTYLLTHPEAMQKFTEHMLDQVMR